MASRLGLASSSRQHPKMCAATWAFAARDASALGGIRTPNLLIRRGCRRPSGSLLSLQSTTTGLESPWNAGWACPAESLLSQPVLRAPCQIACQIHHAPQGLWLAGDRASDPKSEGWASDGRPPSPPIRFRDRPAHRRLAKVDADLPRETSGRETPLLGPNQEQLLDHLDPE
jgi:hypothetical protein